MEKKINFSLPASLIALAVIAMLASCVKTDTATCTNRVESMVLKADGVDSVQVGKNAIFKVTYVILNSCGKFGGIYPATATQTTNVRIFADYEGCICTQVAFQTTRDYTFNSPNPGTYTLSFWGGDNNIITKDIKVYN